MGKTKGTAYVILYQFVILRTIFVSEPFTLIGKSWGKSGSWDHHLPRFPEKKDFFRKSSLVTIPKIGIYLAQSGIFR